MNEDIENVDSYRLSWKTAMVLEAQSVYCCDAWLSPRFEPWDSQACLDSMNNLTYATVCSRSMMRALIDGRQTPKVRTLMV